MENSVKVIYCTFWCNYVMLEQSTGKVSIIISRVVNVLIVRQVVYDANI